MQKLSFKSVIDFFLVICLFLFVFLGVYSNIKQQIAVDRSKIPSEIENSKGFQRWITNLKNNDVDVSADDFVLLEENEIFNTKWTKVFSVKDEAAKELFDRTLRSNLNTKKVIFSPNKQAIIDYRDEKESQYYGIRGDKIVQSRLVECSQNINCIVDRAYFISDNLMVISEISRNIDKHQANIPICNLDQVCTYTVKTHVIDLELNSRAIYESKPFEVVLKNLAPEL